MRKFSIIIIIILVIALIYIAYGTFTKSKTDQEVGVLEGPPGVIVDTSATSNDFLTLLNSVKSVHFSGSLFQDQAFMSLQDFHKELPDRTAGRDDPFAPVASQAQAQFNQTNPAH